MVIDDDYYACEITKQRLESVGYEVVTSDSSVGASQRILEEMPDVLLLDLTMPVLSGDDIIDILNKRASTRNIPIIIHSIQKYSVIEAKAQASGVLGAIEKTGNDELFISQFEHLFDLVRQNQG